jgi:UDP-N-acetylglucosamine 2-epimerase (non-hydrolysing)
LIIIVAGTRPEIIKVAPILAALSNLAIEHKFWVVRQHSDLIDQALDDFNLVPDLDIKLSRQNGGLPELASTLFSATTPHVVQVTPQSIFVVQGDTTTAFIIGYLARILGHRLAHVEAGLRSYDENNPFPEEINRKLLTQIAEINFAPTLLAVENLKSSGIPENQIYQVGNTVVDSLISKIALMTKKDAALKVRSKILVTAHRRENWQTGISKICEGLVMIIEEYPDILIDIISHPNPVLQQEWSIKLEKFEQVNIVHSISYSETVKKIFESTIVLTDSGGIQEESTILGKPTGILRETTERQEVLNFSENRLIGTDPQKIFLYCKSHLDISNKNEENFVIREIFGKGDSGLKIAEILGEKY